jgi:GTP-binding protein YchF
MARLGIVGRPNVGRTTLFNALCGLSAPTAPHPYSTIEANVGVAKIADPRLEAVAVAEGSAKVTPATLELVDVPSAPGVSGGLSGEALGRLREMEALIVVVRAFESPAVPADESGTDPTAQAEELTLEFALADADVFERRAERAAKEATADAARRGEADAIARAAALLADGTPLRAQEWTSAERGHFRDIAPLSLKPAIWVVNVSEDSPAGSYADDVTAAVPSGDTVAVLSARLEEEAAGLDPADRVELFEGLGLGEGALAKVARAANEALGVLTFFTMGPKEARAWTVRRGSTARQAAGRIHSDLERGFIRADVAPIGDVIEAGGWDAAKKAGVVRLEGKEYEVVEGDVIEVRFSV